MTSNRTLTDFVRESNLIEGIDREPTSDEVSAAERFMQLFQLHPKTLNDLQAVFAPNMPLRDRAGMDVRVGNYVAPLGGPNIYRRLNILLSNANGGRDPWRVHVAFEALHPYLDGNGRTGRMIWAWQMRGIGRDPFALPFLHRFYYQTLEASDR